jgi:tripartite-type tricarboxylate transporter receptor subunit TctC
MMALRFVLLRVCTLIAVAVALCMPAKAQQYPARLITFVCPFAPGASADMITRLLAQELQDKLKQTVIVENRAGAGTVVGSTYVAKTAPDGYTLLFAPLSALATNQFMYKSLSYDPVKDFAAISLVGQPTQILVANKSVNAKTLPELIAYIKSKPEGQVTFASPGVGSLNHIAMELFAKMTGLKLTHVPYRGSTFALADVIAGETPMMTIDIPQVQAMIAEGKLTAYGALTTTRSPLLPNLPTIAEAGLPGYSAEGWFAVVAPAGTPAGIIATLNKIIVEFVSKSETQKTFLIMGVQAMTSSPVELQQRIVADSAKWGQVMRDAGIQPQ